MCVSDYTKFVATTNCDEIKYNVLYTRLHEISDGAWLTFVYIRVDVIKLNKNTTVVTGLNSMAKRSKFDTSKTHMQDRSLS